MAGDKMSKVAGTVAVINAINPWLGFALKGVIMALEAKKAFLKANPTSVIDITTGVIYETKEAALLAGVALENIKLELPPFGELIETMSGVFGKLEEEALANWIRVTNS